ncbi:MAG: hypothetical protein JXR48_05750 [Candidatus Delongbacteria bacterium]|nr:hypothetical protein [Candidatus Delongbacteria bacterium]MBN2834454.1 hypothetical protein [Candidatus Delongbacteria bacterium]
MASLSKKIFLASIKGKNKFYISSTDMTYFLIGAIYCELYDKNRFTELNNKFTFSSFIPQEGSYRKIVEDLVTKYGRPRKFSSWIFKTGSKFNLIKELILKELINEEIINSNWNIINEKDWVLDKTEKDYYEKFLMKFGLKGRTKSKPLNGNLVFDAAQYCVKKFRMIIILSFIGFIIFYMIRSL